jgi:hypothetical protein
VSVPDAAARFTYEERFAVKAEVLCTGTARPGSAGRDVVALVHGNGTAPVQIINRARGDGSVVVTVDTGSRC